MARFKLSDRARLRVGAKKRPARRFFPTPGGRIRRAAQRQIGSIGYSAGSMRRASVGGCAPCSRVAKVGAVTQEPLKLQSPGFSGGSSRRVGSSMKPLTLAAAMQHSKRVPPPTRPAGRFGGRGGIGYRYPGSRRIVVVGGELRDIGEAKCVPCSERARAARG